MDFNMSPPVVDSEPIKWEPTSQTAAFPHLPNHSPSADECYGNTNRREQPLRSYIRAPDPEQSQGSQHSQQHDLQIQPYRLQHHIHPTDSNAMYQFNPQAQYGIYPNGQQGPNNHSANQQGISYGQQLDYGEQNPYWEGHARLDNMIADQLGLTRTHLPNANMLSYPYIPDNNPYNSFQGMQSLGGNETTVKSASPNSESLISTEGPQFSNTPQSMNETQFTSSPPFLQGNQHPNSSQSMQGFQYGNAPLPLSPASTDRRGSYLQPRRTDSIPSIESPNQQGTRPTGAGYMPLPTFDSMESPIPLADNESGDDSGSEDEIEVGSTKPKKKHTKGLSEAARAALAKKKHHNEVEKSYRIRLNEHIDALQVVVFGESMVESDENDGSEKAPTGRKFKPPKALVIKTARENIEELRRKNAKLARELEEMKRRMYVMEHTASHSPMSMGLPPNGYVMM